MANMKGVGTAAIVMIVSMYVISKLTTSLNDTNTTSIKENVASAFIDGSALLVIAVIGVVLALGLPALFKALQS